MFSLRKLTGRLFTSKYRIGDRVIHAATRQFGRVVEVQKLGKRQLVSVALDFGGELHLLDRMEFMLAGKNER
jgi:hypothetical protein